MDHLINGFRRFRETYWRENQEALETLATRGQSPYAMVIGCSDSRADPQTIFDAALGEIFVVRNVANLVPPYTPDTEHHGTSAALEFAVRSLKVRHLIVMGHSRCGGINALLNGPPEGDDFIAPWMQIAAPARERALASAGGRAEEAQHLCEKEGIKISLDNLMTFPWVRQRVEEGALTLHGLYYDIDRGDLQRLDDKGEFRPV
ncbi:MAG TPA: carbonic anhydrase [Alphaproteobacteria bacterium]|nr:carbonic anhydrase [Alphaproteobacteria bacterium]